MQVASQELVQHTLADCIPALSCCQAIDELCHLLAAGTPLVTLRADVSSKEAAEQVARALTANSSIMHLMLGGPVPEHVLSFIGATLSSNTLCRYDNSCLSPVLCHSSVCSI